MKLILKDNLGNIWIEKDITIKQTKAIREFVNKNEETCLDDFFRIIEENKD